MSTSAMERAAGYTLAESEAAFRAALAPDSVMEFDVGALDRVGVPVWTAWWRGPAGQAGGMGYGPTVQRARVGGLGELIEHVAARRFLATATARTGSRRELLAACVGDEDVVDPRLLGLVAGSAYDDDRLVRWLPTRRWSDGATVWVPAEFVAGSPGDLQGQAPPQGWLIVPVSNGMGAGNSIEMAVAHAIGEILQRDGNGLVFRALDRGIVLDLAGLNHPAALATLQSLAAAGVEVMVKLADTGNGVVNVYAVGAALDDDVIVATACGEAAHPDRGEAVAKALAEFAAARARKAFQHGSLEVVSRVASAEYMATVIPNIDPGVEEQRVLAAMVAWRESERSEWESLLRSSVLSHRGTVAFGDLPEPPDLSAGVLRYLTDQLAAEGFDVLVADFSAAVAGDGAPVHAVKLIVPGMEVETVAYGRLGDRNAGRLVHAGRDDLVRVGARLDGWDRIHLTAAGEVELGGPAWLNRSALDDVCGALLPLYREPGRHAVARMLAED